MTPATTTQSLPSASRSRGKLCLGTAPQATQPMRHQPAASRASGAIRGMSPMRRPNVVEAPGPSASGAVTGAVTIDAYPARMRAGAQPGRIPVTGLLRTRVAHRGQQKFPRQWRLRESGQLMQRQPSPYSASHCELSVQLMPQAAWTQTHTCSVVAAQTQGAIASGLSPHSRCGTVGQK